MQKVDVAAHDSGDGQRFEVFLEVLVQPFGHIGTRGKRFERGQYWRGGQGSQQQGIGELSSLRAKFLNYTQVLQERISRGGIVFQAGEPKLVQSRKQVFQYAPVGK